MQPASVRGAFFGGLVAMALGAAAAWRGCPSSDTASSVRPQASAPPADSSPNALQGPPLELPQPPTAAPAAPPGPVVSASPEPPLDEAALMVRLRQSKDVDAALCVDLARQGNRRFPDSADAPERASILIHSLASLGRASEARGEAEEMVNRYPDSNWVREIERFTGAHRHRNFRLAEDGSLESY